MEYAFPKPQTIEEAVRENKRTIEKAMQNISRQQAQCRADEKKKMKEIKKLGIGGDAQTIRAMVKDIVASRNYVTYCERTKTQLSAVNRQLGMMGSTAALGTTIKVTAGLMVSLSHIVNVPELMYLQQVFARQNQLFELVQGQMEQVTSGMTSTLDRNGTMDADVKVLEESIFQELGEEFQAKFGDVKTGDEVDQYNDQLMREQQNRNNKGGGGGPPPPGGGGGGGDLNAYQASVENAYDNDVDYDEDDFSQRLALLKKPTHSAAAAAKLPPQQPATSKVVAQGNSLMRTTTSSTSKQKEQQDDQWALVNQ